MVNTIHSFIPPLNKTFILPFIHSFKDSDIQTLVHSFITSLTNILIQTFIHPSIHHSLIHPSIDCTCIDVTVPVAGPSPAAPRLLYPREAAGDVALFGGKIRFQLAHFLVGGFGDFLGQIAARHSANRLRRLKCINGLKYGHKHPGHNHPGHKHPGHKLPFAISILFHRICRF